MSSEEINNIPDNGAQEQVVDNTPQTDAAPEQVQQPIEIPQELIDSKVNQAVGNNPQFQQYMQYQEFLRSQQENEVSPFDQELGLENITDAAKHLYDQSGQTNERLSEYEQKLQFLEAKEAQRDYEAAMETFTTSWEDQYADEESFNNAIKAVITSNPTLSQQFQQAQQTGVPLNADFIAQLNDSMSIHLANQLRDPNSGALQALVEQQAKRKALQNQSMLSSNTQTTDSGKTQDPFSSTLTIFDD